VETLSLEDIQNLNQCIQKIYTLHAVDTFGVDALSIVTQLVPSNLPVFHSTHIQTRKISSTFLPDFPGFTPEMEGVVHQYFGEHPITQHMPQTLTGAYKISDFVNEKELHALVGIYQQFLRLLDTEDQMFFFLMSPNPFSWFKLLQTEATLIGFALHRSQRNFTERDRLILNLLRPHLFQAYTNAQKYHQLQQKSNQLQQSLARLNVVVLDAKGVIVSIAPQAILWLETYFSKSICSIQLPDTLWSWVKHQVNCASKNIDCSKACLPLRIQHTGKQLVVRLIVEQAGERYLLLLEEQTPSLLNSLEMLGLSDRETEILAWLIQGRDNQAIAIQLNISINTVRKHLENIYRKLGVKSRMEASARALEKLGFIHFLPLR
jgi:DNA-binding CsgD family transcriptional regulator